MFTNEAFAVLKSSALVIAGKCVWRSLQSAVKLLPPKVLQSGLSGAIPSLLHKRHSAQAGRRQHSVWLEALWKICVFLRGRLSWLMNIKEENVLLNYLSASNCLCELVLFIFSVHLLPCKRGRESVIPLWSYPHIWCILHILYSCQENSKLIGST